MPPPTPSQSPHLHLTCVKVPSDGLSCFKDVLGGGEEEGEKGEGAHY